MRTRAILIFAILTLALAPVAAAGAATVSSQAVWPSASHAPYSDPRQLTYDFAHKYLAFTSPVVGSYQAGDSMSGEVNVRAASRGTVTTVLVRRLGTARNWYVIGAIGATISITVPLQGATVLSPLSVRGRSTAFEGVVNLALKTSSGVVLASATALGGSMGVMGSYRATLTFHTTDPSYANLIVRERSAKDGGTAVASVIRLRLC